MSCEGDILRSNAIEGVGILGELADRDVATADPVAAL